MGYSEPIQKVIHEFSRLPGIGEKTAERLAFYLLAQSRDEGLTLAHAIRDLKEKVKSCSVCYNITEQDPCPICSDKKRDLNQVCVVEQMKDLWAIEKSGAFRGGYHVLHGTLAPIDGVGPEDLTIRKLIERVKQGGANEVILATNPTIEGDATAFFIRKAIDGFEVKVSRLARGISAGSSLEYANRTIVSDAFQGRREF
jgi:recombination protein RecR|tara:strand:+ start:223 stop:819 length:597 start_codon:yes stop_codon:yes gene_type:complete